ncbi:DUF4838 domain-containing protein [Paenibacillus eucommiae]|uniref:DUF4838 domain-containing protein n=1 Tax=Paenibacillus eucommiae TaxID=1355755 RepID=A0ABS4IRB8_9BACL|nr:DUF4838 domain-containing protein [Paenibacillus eucommiae]MBP1989441.1 hypothetical protein [Paenibacillus eucommiae]
MKSELHHGMNISNGGQILAVALIAPDASGQTRSAAEMLIRYLQQSTGGSMQLQSTLDSKIPDGMYRIYIGTIPPESKSEVDKLLTSLGSDGFVLFPHEDSLTIIGSTPWGTEFGVIEFLERYVGVSWLLPGADGEDVPHRPELCIPFETIREEPASISRHFFGTEPAGSLAEWAKRNRMHDSIHFHHNMTVLFDTQVFADHAEYYPDGLVPTHPDNWQPCMNEATAAAAIQRIIAFFDENPEEISYSLGINDSLNYCEANPQHPNYTGKINSIGYLDMSDVYYPWVNKIVEGVLQVYPDKYFGLLAYWNVYDPPTTVRLHPRVIPYITDDRMSWIEPDKQTAGHHHTERWQLAADHLAFYEYLYGNPYCVPRMYVNKMAENYVYAENHGVIAHVAELFPNFGEGPKPWISAKLQWNPKQDVTSLMNEWVVRAVGAEAAPFLQQYFDKWELFWTTSICSTAWYRKWADSSVRYNFLDLFDPSYLQDISFQDIVECRQLMEQVVVKAATDAQKKRAQLLMCTFEYYEASVLSYMQSHGINLPASAQEALELLIANSQCMEFADKRLNLITQFQAHPAIFASTDLFSFQGVWIWRGTERAITSGLLDWIKHTPDKEAFMEQLEIFARDEQKPFLRDYALFVLAVMDQKKNVIETNSLDMTAYIHPDQQALAWKWTLREISGLSHGTISLDAMPLEVGTYGAVVQLNVLEESQAQTCANWYFPILDENNEIVDQVITGRVPVSSSEGAEIELEVIFEVAKEGCKVPLTFQIYDIKQGEDFKVGMKSLSLYSLNNDQNQI